MNETTSDIGKYAVAQKFHDSLMRSQWLPQDRIVAYQERQLQQMLSHAHAKVAYYEVPLGRIRLSDGSFDLRRWQELPILTRETVVANWEALQAHDLPAGHEEVLQMATSGSAGSALSIRTTRFDHAGTACASYRYADWFDYDFAVPLAMIRAGFIRPQDPTSIEDTRWGPPWRDPATRGSRHRLHISTPAGEQLEWLATLGRVYLNTLPSNAMTLVQLSEERGIKLQIAGLMTVGESLTQDVRDEVRRVWGCRVSDVYSTAETGLVAIECPDTGTYHLQTEISRTEVIDQNGMPCPPGGVGHIVCTSLYNFAMPLIRYRSGDLAEVGQTCSCGRNLPVISRILGREQNLIQRHDGVLYAPELSTRQLHEIAGVRQWQLEQCDVHRFIFRMIQSSDLEKTTADKLRSYLRAVLGPDSAIVLEPVEKFPRTSGGKFYPFIRNFSGSRLWPDFTGFV